MNPIFLTLLVTLIIIGWPILVVWNEWKKFHAKIPNDLGWALRIAPVALIAEAVIGWSIILHFYFANTTTTLLAALFAVLVYVMYSSAVLLIWTLGIGFQEFEEARDEEYYA